MVPRSFHPDLFPSLSCARAIGSSTRSFESAAHPALGNQSLGSNGDATQCRCERQAERVRKRTWPRNERVMFWTVSISKSPSESSIGMLRSQPEERSSSVSLRVIPVRSRRVRTRARAQDILRQGAKTCQQSPASPSCPGKHVACAPRRLISSSNALHEFRVPRKRLAFETLRTTPVIFAFVSPLRNVRSLAPARSASDRRWWPHQAKNALGEPGSAGERKRSAAQRLAHRIVAHESPGVMSSRGQSQDTARSAGPLALVFALRGLGPLLLEPCSLRASLRSIEERGCGDWAHPGIYHRTKLVWPLYLSFSSPHLLQLLLKGSS